MTHRFTAWLVCVALKSRSSSCFIFTWILNHRIDVVHTQHRSGSLWHRCSWAESMQDSSNSSIFNNYTIWAIQTLHRCRATFQKRCRGGLTWADVNMKASKCGPRANNDAWLPMNWWETHSEKPPPKTKNTIPNRSPSEVNVNNVNPPDALIGNINVTMVKQQSKAFQPNWLRIYLWLELIKVKYWICNADATEETVKKGTERKERNHPDKDGWGINDCKAVV